MRELYFPENLLLQWHITENCNLRCQHCYQQSFTEKEPTFENLLKVLNEFEFMVLKMREYHAQKRCRAHINITGGEPFIYSHFFDLLEELTKRKKIFSFGILTNGTLIKEAELNALKKFPPAFIQMSLEGAEATNNEIRGHNNFHNVLTAAKKVQAINIPVMISFTANKKNYKEFPLLVREVQKAGISKIWADRYIPNSTNDALMLSATETDDFFNIMQKSKKSFFSRFYRKTEISMQRALQFLVGGGKPYTCTAGDSLITILQNGKVLPCRRMPIEVGNVLENSLFSIYQENEFLKSLRNKNNTPEECNGCFYKKNCKGGLKCLSFALSGNPFGKDPHCKL